MFHSISGSNRNYLEVLVALGSGAKSGISNDSGSGTDTRHKCNAIKILFIARKFHWPLFNAKQHEILMKTPRNMHFA